MLWKNSKLNWYLNLVYEVIINTRSRDYAGKIKASLESKLTEDQRKKLNFYIGKNKQTAHLIK